LFAGFESDCCAEDDPECGVFWAATGMASARSAASAMATAAAQGRAFLRVARREMEDFISAWPARKALDYIPNFDFPSFALSWSFDIVIGYPRAPKWQYAHPS
jgi:hypothetical protein